MSHLPDWLGHRAAATPERTALVAGGRTWTFAELDTAANRVAGQLHAHGVRRGDRVATLLHNGHAPVMLLHALLRLGATLVPLNVRLSAAEVQWQLQNCAARMAIVEARTASLVGDGASVRTSDDDGVRSSPAHRRCIVVDVDALLPGVAGATGGDLDAGRALHHAHDPAHVLAIIYTSGTTGRPKGAMLTVANVWWSAVGSALNLGMVPGDRWLAVLPLFHVGGLSILVRSAIGGFTAVVHDAFDAEAANDAIDRDGVTVVSLVAVMLQRMLDARGARPYPATLRCVLLGGGPAPLALLERCAALNVPVVQTYGLTETASQIATLPPEDALRRLGAAGKPLYPNAVRIASNAGEVVAAGAAGEIQVRGPVVVAGYVGRADAEHLTADGWLRTGDVGRIDADGYLHVVDRRDDLIITGGENVYPAEVEAALLAHPAVREAGVIGTPDDTWGQRVVAFVRLAGGGARDTGADDLRAHCRSLLAGYKIPREVHILEGELPRTASGKLRRAALRERLDA